MLPVSGPIDRRALSWTSSVQSYDGITFQYRSSQWNTSCHTAKNTSDGTIRLVQRDIRNTNGNAQNPTSIAMLTQLQSPNSRYLYQTVSSGMLPYHCSMNWENAVYAQKKVNANIHLPMSW